MKKILILLTVLGFLNCAHPQIPIPETGCYHAAFTGTDTQQAFETLAGKEIAIEMFFTGWPSNKVADFPLSKCNTIVSGGAVPHITWMCEVNGSPYPLDAIINGQWDNFITNYATSVKNWGLPLFIRLGHEMNGDWYKYGGANNGGGTLIGFGDPNVADGPERFIAAFKHVHNIFENVGADNVAWIWCPNNGSSPTASWNTPEAYYPGDDYVDWIGFDGYNFGTSQTWSGWVEFHNIYTELYQKFQNYGKPLMIGEFASVESGGQKSNWITNAYSIYLKYSFPKIKAVTWFHVEKVEGTVMTNWKINSSELSLQAYKNAIADPYYLSAIVPTDVEEDLEIPNQFSLEQNYPNPFNPTTTITYTIPTPPISLPLLRGETEGGVVTLKVYNILGKEIATLVNEYQSPGKYSVTYNVVKTHHGASLPSGIYFYTLKVSSYAYPGLVYMETKKMLLIK